MPKRVQVQLAPSLREYSSHRSEMEFEAGSLGSVLERMQAKYPHVYECVCNETGRIRPHIHVFVNSELVGTSAIADMQRAIAEDDIVTIWTAVSGG